jgi:hypothetical protein
MSAIRFSQRDFLRMTEGGVVRSVSTGLNRWTGRFSQIAVNAAAAPSVLDAEFPLTANVPLSYGEASQGSVDRKWKDTVIGRPGERVIGIVPRFTDCHAHGHLLKLAGGAATEMKCFWTAMASIALAIPTSVSGILMALESG